jgi:hypothetical protein
VSTFPSVWLWGFAIGVRLGILNRLLDFDADDVQGADRLNRHIERNRDALAYHSAGNVSPGVPVELK